MDTPVALNSRSQASAGFGVAHRRMKDRLKVSVASKAGWKPGCCPAIPLDWDIAAMCET
jgi:hypothetical protein